VLAAGAQILRAEMPGRTGDSVEEPNADAPPATVVADDRSVDGEVGAQIPMIVRDSRANDLARSAPPQQASAQEAHGPSAHSAKPTTPAATTRATTSSLSTQFISGCMDRFSLQSALGGERADT